MFCKECGNEINDKAVICPKCGCSTEEKKIERVENAKKSNKVVFTTRGRISRIVFWKYMGVSLLLCFLSGFLIAISLPYLESGKSAFHIILFILGAIMGIAGFFYNLVGYVRRIQDFGISSWVLLLLFIPYLNILANLIFFIMCGFFKAEDKPNKYGLESNVL